MTSHETAIAERLRQAADRIPVDTSMIPFLEGGRGRRSSTSSHRRRRMIVGAVAVAATVAGLALWVGSRPTPDTVTAATASGDDREPTRRPTPPACLGNRVTPEPCSPSVAAHLASPPPWFGEPQGGFRSGAIRTGRWVSMAIGRVSTDRITDPILVSVFDGTYRDLSEAVPVTIGDRSLRSAQYADWLVLATNETPTVVVTGEVDQDTLAAVLAAAEVGDVAGELSVQLGSLPEGYSEVVPPRPLGTDYDYYRVLGSESADTGIGEASNWADPLLAAVAGGADLAAVDVGGTTGWTGSTAGWEGSATVEAQGPMRFLIWSPRPGLVFEISTENMQLTADDLVDLALVTSELEPSDWDARYVGR